MKGFKSIEELSLKSCYNFLSSEKNREHTLYPAIAERYQEMLQDLEKQDASDYAACKTMDNYNAYIKKFSDNSIAPYYKAKHIYEAKNAIEDLFWNTHKKSVGGCKEYLSRYPKGKYAIIANNRIGSSKKTKWLVLGIVLIVLVITFFIGYKPVNSLSVSESSLSFGKWGGQESVRVSTNVPSNAVDVHCSGLGFSVHNDPNRVLECSDFIVSVEPNEGDTRTGKVRVTAYATLYGMRIGSGESVSTSLSQESGLARKLDVSIRSVNAGKWGGDCQFTVKTDGVKNVNAISQEDWIKVLKGEGDNYVISVEKNPNDSRHGIVIIESGNLQKEITVNQVSGLANRFSLDRSNIKVGKSGSTYRVNVSTDGVSWDIYSSPSWVTITKYDNSFDLTVAYNSDEIKNGNVVVKSNNGHKSYINISQDGSPTSFYASPSSLTFDTDGGSKQITVTNNSNQNISVSTSTGWLSAYINGNKVKIYCSSNDDSPHDGTVTLSCCDKSISISVHQKGYGRCGYCKYGHKSCSHCNNGTTSCKNSNYSGVFDQFGQYGHGRNVPIYSYGYIVGWRLEVCPTCGGTFKVKCSYCDGDGEVLCSHCGGRGRVKKD